MFRLFFFTILFTCDCYSINEYYYRKIIKANLELRPINTGPIPIYWDWREWKMVSPVKDQKSCNACWAFSSVANIESHLMIYLNQSTLLSEQFLIDCDGRNVGCSSASVLDTFSIIVNKLGGVLKKDDYIPYEGKLLPCSWSGYPRPVPVVGYRRVKSDEAVMVAFLYNYGPLSARINSASMDIYKGGIDEPTDELCPPTNMNHAILIVGYNVYVDPKTRKMLPYWIIKNSWGTKWGDNGFYYLVLGRNACGIANDVSLSIVV